MENANSLLRLLSNKLCLIFNVSMIAIKLLLFLITIFFQELNSQTNEELEIDRVWSELILSVKKEIFQGIKLFIMRMQY